MKKRVMNIRPQEVTVGGERSVQYKGSDGKQHPIQPLIVATTINELNMTLATDVTYSEIRKAIESHRIIIVDINAMGYAPVVVIMPTPGEPQYVLSAIISVESILMQVNLLATEDEPVRGTISMLNSSNEEPTEYGYITADEANNTFLTKEDAAEEYVKKTDALAPVNGFGITILSQQEFNAIAEPQQNVIYIIT